MIVTRRRFLESRKNYTNFIIGNVDWGFYWKTIILENLWKIILFVEWKSVYVLLFKSIVLIEKPFMFLKTSMNICNCWQWKLCSFVAKLRWKKKFFFLKKYLCFLQNIHYLQKKCFYMEKKFYIENFFTEKNFFYREKYKWKCKNIYLIWEIYFYAENVCVTNKI